MAKPTISPPPEVPYRQCPNCYSEVQKYNSDVLKFPWPVPEKGFHEPFSMPVHIDGCLTGEIKALWAMGIKTVECCCGHGEGIGYIAVEPDFEFRMVSLGYRKGKAPSGATFFKWPKPKPKWPEMFHAFHFAYQAGLADGRKNRGK